jgi:tetratricopeptide (TPR) repeat protein
MRRCLILIAALFLAAGLVWAADSSPQPAPDASPAPPSAPPPQSPVAAPDRAEAATVPMAEKVQLLSPIDGGPVDGWKIGAFVTAGVDTDFCYLNASESYYQKLLATDPRTGYTGYVDDFPPNLKTPLSADLVEKIRKKIPKMFDLKRLEPWDRYAIVAQIYIWRKMPAKDIANAYLRATYTMRGLALSSAERDREIELRKKAIQYLLDADEAADFTMAETPQVKYLIGELYRRNAKFDKALDYFNDALKLKNRPEWLDEMVIRQKARAYGYDDR